MNFLPTNSIRGYVKYMATHVPQIKNENNQLSIEFIPRERDLVDRFLDYSAQGALGLIGGGGLGLLSNYLNSDEQTRQEEGPGLPYYFLGAGVLLGGIHRFVATLNNHRHTQNFYHLYDQAQDQIRAQ